MTTRKLLTFTMMFTAIILSAGFIHAVNQPYIATFTEGDTVILMQLTRTDTGITNGPPVVHAFGRIVGSTAVDVIRDAAGNVTQIRVYVTYVPPPPGFPAGSLLTFTPALQFVSETPLPKLKPGQYQPLDILKSGNAKRLLGAGIYPANANDYVGYALNSAGIVTGPKKTYFANPTGLTIASASAARDGGMTSQLTLPVGIVHNVGKRPVNNTTGNPSGAATTQPFNDFFGYSQDVTLPIESTTPGSSPATGTRYLVFRAFRNPGTPTSQSQVQIQNIDATTGVPLAVPRALTNFAKAPNVGTERFQGIGIVPDGGLILYSSYLGSCKKNVLKAQRLANGVKVGGPKTLFGCNLLTNSGFGVYGVNIDSL